MPSGPVAESESRFDSKISTLSEEKDTAQVQLGATGLGGYRKRWVSDTRFKPIGFGLTVILPLSL